MKIHITRVNIAWANKEGQPYLDKNQKPYARVGIQTQEHGKTWLSGFAYQGEKPLNWKSGDEADVEVEQKGDFTNFRLPKASSGGWSPKMVEDLFTMLRRIEDKIDNLELVTPEAGEAPTHSDEPDSENNPPF